jgi:branched-chain amino acid transport system permease protein
MFQLIFFNITNGLIIGAFYAVMAIGLSLILNLSGVINFAHGGFLVIGGSKPRVQCCDTFPNILRTLIRSSRRSANSKPISGKQLSGPFRASAAGSAL